MNKTLHEMSDIIDSMEKIALSAMQKDMRNRVGPNGQTFHSYAGGPIDISGVESAQAARATRAKQAYNAEELAATRIRRSGHNIDRTITAPYYNHTPPNPGRQVANAAQPVSQAASHGSAAAPGFVSRAASRFGRMSRMGKAGVVGATLAGAGILGYGASRMLSGGRQRPYYYPPQMPYSGMYKSSALNMSVLKKHMGLVQKTIQGATKKSVEWGKTNIPKAITGAEKLSQNMAVATNKYAPRVESISKNVGTSFKNLNKSIMNTRNNLGLMKQSSWIGDIMSKGRQFADDVARAAKSGAFEKTFQNVGRKVENMAHGAEQMGAQFENISKNIGNTVNRVNQARQNVVSNLSGAPKQQTPIRVSGGNYRQLWPIAAAVPAGFAGGAFVEQATAPRYPQKY